MVRFKKHNPRKKKKKKTKKNHREGKEETLNHVEEQIEAGGASGPGRARCCCGLGSVFSCWPPKRGRSELTALAASREEERLHLHPGRSEEPRGGR